MADRGHVHVADSGSGAFQGVRSPEDLLKQLFACAITFQAQYVVVEELELLLGLL